MLPTVVDPAPPTDPAAPAAPPPPSRLQRARSAYEVISDIVTPQRLVVLLVVAALAVVGLVGGWGEVAAEESEITDVAAGTPFAVAPYEVTVRRARTFTELPPTFRAERDHRYLALVLDVVNRSDVPVVSSHLTRGATLDAPGLKQVRLASGVRAADPLLYRGLDGLSASTLQPGLATPTVLVWQQRLAEPVPETVTVTFSTHTWRRSSLDGHEDWFDATPSHAVTLPVEAVTP